MFCTYCRKLHSICFVAFVCMNVIYGAPDEIPGNLLSRFEAGREAVAEKVAEHPTGNANGEVNNGAEEGNAEVQNARIKQDARAASDIQTVIQLPKSKSGDEKVLLVGQDGNVTISRGPHYMSVEANNVL